MEEEEEELPIYLLFRNALHCSKDQSRFIRTKRSLQQNSSANTAMFHRHLSA
jgi:hypothetical protein